MAKPDFWSDKEKAKKISQEQAGLRKELEDWQEIDEKTKDLSETDPSIEMKLEAVGRALKILEIRTLFSGKYDEQNAILSVHAGAGGTEAQDWAQMLLRMLFRFAENKDWQTEILHESKSDEGLKSATARISGRQAYGHLKSEHGVHRLVRISPFDAEKLRHTSFALVEVLPELEEIPEIEIDSKDLRIDTFLASGHGGQSVQKTASAVRIVHLPTGITVSCQNERSQQQNKDTAMKILKTKLHQKSEKEQEEKKQKLRGEQVSAEWGSQIRSYVLHPYKLVKDHRTGFEVSDAEAVLDGKLEGFIEAYLRWRAEGDRKLKS